MTIRNSLLALIIAVATSAAALASTITVTSTADSGSGSLRDAIANAMPGDVINFAPALNGQTITLIDGAIAIDKRLTLMGPGASLLTISAGNASGVLIVAIGATDVVNLTGLTIADGSANFGGNIAFTGGTLNLSGMAIRTGFAAGQGGGVYQVGGTLNLFQCVVSGNTSDVGADGPGIFSTLGVLSISQSTISGNIAGEDGIGGGVCLVQGMLTAAQSTFSGNFASEGGGLFIGDPNGAIPGSQASIDQCTVSGNSAGFRGGAIHLNAGNLLQLKRSTVARNSAASGGGIYKNGSASSSIQGTILAENGPGGNHGGTGSSSLGYNLSDDVSCVGFFTQPGDLNNTPAGLNPNGLQNNGGPTLTIALVQGSLAIGAGDPAFVPPPSVDQRGSGFARVSNGRIDIGAFEVQATAPRTMKIAVRDDLVLLRGSLTPGDRKKLDDAISHLEKSIEAGKWIDASHPAPGPKGDGVFNEEKTVVIGLRSLRIANQSGISSGVFQGFINRLLDADRQIGVIAINEAIARHGNAGKIANAQSELSKGDADAAADKPDKAIDHYKTAWKSASGA